MDRANVARRLLQQNGVSAGQVVQVPGYADQRLRKPDKPEDPSNRRVSLIVQYLAKEDNKSPDDNKGKNDPANKEDHP